MFAMAGYSDAKLFAALAKEARQLLDQFNTQDLANTAWAFATVSQLNVVLFAVLARLMERRVSEFNA